MKREIKFRIFSEMFTEKRMFYDVETVLKDDGRWWLCNAKTRMFQSTSDRWKLMQFTGLLDKNKIEIWEGDIIGQRGMKNMTIIFENGSFKLKEDTQKAVWLKNLNEVHLPYIEVIGNVYENAELLTPTP